MGFGFVRLVVLLTAIGAALWAPGGMAVNVLVSSDQAYMPLNSTQYLSSGNFYLVLQPDCNLILYNGSQPVMSSNTSCYVPTDEPNITRTDLALSLHSWSNTIGDDFGSQQLVLSIYEIFFSGSESAMIGSETPIWSYSWGRRTSSSEALFPYMILRENGTVAFYDFNTNQLLGDDVEQKFLQPYSIPAPAPANASGGSNIGYPFPPVLAWKPTTSLANFPYMPAGYYLSQGSKLQTVDQRFSLTLRRDCNLQSKDNTKNGSEGFLLWESGSASTEQVEQVCDMVLQQDGRLVVHHNVSGRVFWSSTATGNVSVSWILRMSSSDGSLSISDIDNSTNILWSNVGRINQSSSHRTTTTWIVVGVSVGVFVLAMAGFAILFFSVRTKNVVDGKRADVTDE